MSVIQNDVHVKLQPRLSLDGQFVERLIITPGSVGWRGAA